MGLQLGDVVQLKSGSPKMTVESINEQKRVSCTWFSGDEVRSSTFNPEMLKKYRLSTNENGTEIKESINLWD